MFFHDIQNHHALEFGIWKVQADGLKDPHPLIKSISRQIKNAKKAPPGKETKSTKYIAGLFPLKIGDMLTVQVDHKIELDMNPDTSFFGAIQMTLKS